MRHFRRPAITITIGCESFNECYSLCWTTSTNKSLFTVHSITGSIIHIRIITILPIIVFNNTPLPFSVLNQGSTDSSVKLSHLFEKLTFSLAQFVEPKTYLKMTCIPHSILSRRLFSNIPNMMALHSLQNNSDTFLKFLSFCNRLQRMNPISFV